MRNSMLTTVALLAACTHAGAGQGTLQSARDATGTRSEGTVKFAWKSGSDPSKGSIQATLPDGETLHGDFLEQTGSAKVVGAVGPYYRGWPTYAGGPGPWSTWDTTGFFKVYGGKVVAHLVSSEGTRMRCNFLLRDPGRGMPGGATGDCQLSDRKTVFRAKLRGRRS